jgi:hypothetical protein
MNNRMESNNLNQSQGESNYSPPPNIYPNQSSLEMGANQFNSHEIIYQNENPSIGTSQDNPPAEQVGENQNSRPEETEEKKNHQKRRSKSEVEGRTFECKLCQKSYLSYPALYTHYKLKHNTNNSSGKGRGRPKKDQNMQEIEKSRFNPLNDSFFAKEERTGSTETGEIKNCICEAFNQLYHTEDNKKRNNLKEMKWYEKIEDHPFLKKYMEDPHDVKKNFIGEEHSLTDTVLMYYLNKVSLITNQQYFIKVIKFVTLYREHVNIFNQNKVKEGQQYTEVKDAEDVPDSSNEFITEFLHPEGTETDFGFTKDESIDLTQNLCYWMYENNFTCSKLSLINDK